MKSESIAFPIELVKISEPCRPNISTLLIDGIKSMRCLSTSRPSVLTLPMWWWLQNQGTENQKENQKEREIGQQRRGKENNREDMRQLTRLRCAVCKTEQCEFTRPIDLFVLTLCGRKTTESTATSFLWWDAVSKSATKHGCFSPSAYLRTKANLNYITLMSRLVLSKRRAGFGPYCHFSRHLRESS